MKNISPVRGTHDLLGTNLVLYKKIEKIIYELASNYDFTEIITPVFENSELFKKPLGENSDVVLKEMYTFEDRNKSFITLRPEYTTPMIRAAISNKLLTRLPIKLFGIGPMFRRERPQKGRYRQFNQINFEIFGSSDFFTDSELIILGNEFLKKLKLNNKIKLYLNSLGDLNTLFKYKEALSEYFNKYKNDLSLESKLKIKTNPLRILDSKNINDIKINKEAPKIYKFYSEEANKIFENVKNFLTNSGINFEVDNNLVRGLDYYCHTVFEFKTKVIGSQSTVIGGGRYDGLVQKLGGPNISGVGWACGVERLAMMLDEIKINPPLAQLIIIDEKYKAYGLNALLKLRKMNFRIRFDYKYNLKKSLIQAIESKIKYVIIVGENEKNKHIYTIKNIVKKSQISINFEELVNVLNS